MIAQRPAISRRTISRRTVLGAVLLAALSACDRRRTPHAERTPDTDSNAALRVVSLSPAVSVILRDLGRAGDVVGRHAYELVLDDSLPVCGDQTGLDLEALRRVRPTHIITQWGTRTLPAPVREAAAANAWTIHDAALLSLDDIEREILALDTLLTPGGTPRGRALLETFRAAMRPEPAAANAGRVLLLGAVEPPGALGPGSCHHALLTRLGVTPALTTGGAWQSLTLEDIRALAPDAIIAFRPRPRDRADASAPARTPPDAAAILAPLARANTPAHAHGRLAVIDDPLGLLPATSLAGVAESVRGLLRTWTPG